MTTLRFRFDWLVKNVEIELGSISLSLAVNSESLSDDKQQFLW